MPSTLQPCSIFSICVHTGSAGTQLNLEGNFVRVKIGAGMLFHYHVDFCPPQESQRLKSGLLYHHKDVLGKATVFDGMALFLLHKLPDDVRFIPVCSLSSRCTGVQLCLPESVVVEIVPLMCVEHLFAADIMVEGKNSF